MSTPFLMAFSVALVARLLETGHLEVSDGEEQRVAVFLADALGRQEPGQQLITSVERALLACPEVVELYADDEVLKETVDSLHDTFRPR